MSGPVFATSIDGMVCSPDTAVLFPFISLAAYLIGSIPFGLILTRVFGYGDIRTIGSGNIGATNVLRSGNKKLALLTLLLDGSKGAALIIALLFLSACFSSIYKTKPEYFCIFGLFAILGHCFPVWLKFKGGKGVATALGVLLAAVPYAGMISCATWLLIAFIFKYSSLAALVAIAVAPVAAGLIYGTASGAVCFMITLIVWWRHKANIKRLLKGEEPKIGSKKKDGASDAAEH